MTKSLTKAEVLTTERQTQSSKQWLSLGMKQRGRREGRKQMQVFGNIPILKLNSEFMTTNYVFLLHFSPVIYTVLHIYVVLYGKGKK